MSGDLMGPKWTLPAQVLERLEWEAALISEVSFPKADGADKTAGSSRVVIRPQATSSTAGTAAGRGS